MIEARLNLERVLLDEFEKEAFAYHELNPPPSAVAIDPHPAELVTLLDTDTPMDVFRKQVLELPADKRCIMLHNKRDSHRGRYQSEVSAVCSTALKANTLMSVMPSMVAAKSAVYYLAKYFKKDSCTPKDLLILYHKAKILQERYPSTVTWTWEYNRIYLTTY